MSKKGEEKKRGEEKKSRKRKAVVDEDELTDEELAATTSLPIPKERDFSNLPLKSDHERRPIWVCPDGRVFLETYSPIYKQAYDFLIAISDPVSRPHFIHEYRITNYSLYAAASLGLRTEDILSGLSRLAKMELPERLKKLVHEKTRKCGKVKLLLKKSRYFVESADKDILTTLLTNETISSARIDHLPPDQRPVVQPAFSHKKSDLRNSAFNMSGLPKPSSSSSSISSSLSSTSALSDLVTADSILDEKEPDQKVDGETRDLGTGYLMHDMTMDETGVNIPGAGRANASAAMGLEVDDLVDDNKATTLYSIEIHPSKVQEVRKTCNDMSYPMLEEYDFRKDTTNVELPINLRPSAIIRDYQEKSLSKMFGNGRARSGIIVLPCGAGKTLVGITAATTIRKSTLVFCTTGVAVEQWKQQFLKWTSIDPKYVCMFTSATKDRFTTDALVVITTYNMVAYTGEKRSDKAIEAMELITKQEWGLVILDEVHVAPAAMFRKCVSITHSRCKMGLTATLVREDDLIEDLFFLVGPKLYEANWLDLQRQGYLATVQCVEVWCPMTPRFYDSYLTESSRKQSMLYVMNPNKFRSCEYLIRLHESRGDKVLIFSDNVFALEFYSKTLGVPFIYGKTSEQERMQCLNNFQHNPKINVLLISKVGDNSIDLPDVNVIIQISSHFSSRRQEAQRLGRILRPKSKATGRFNAFFYTLVSRDTKEMYYATKRQRFLVDQGYSFKVVTELAAVDQMKNLHFDTQAEQDELLSRVMSVSDTTLLEDDPDELQGPSKPKASRRTGSIEELTGADDRAYAEVSGKSKPGAKPKGKKSRHSMFQTRDTHLKSQKRG